MSVTNNTRRPKTSNMEEIIACSLRLLDMDLEIVKKDSVDVSHPFFSCRILVNKETLASGKIVDLVGNPEELRAAKASLREQLHKCTSPVEVFRLFSIRFLFLNLTLLEKWMSVDDMSAVLRYVWQHGVYAANTSILPKKDLLEMLRTCNLKILMDEEDYAAYQALPDEMTLYRGANPNNKLLIKSPSWTLDSSNIVRLYNLWAIPFGTYSGKAYTAKIRKQDVFAYFEDFSAVIVHPDKLYKINSYLVAE